MANSNNKRQQKSARRQNRKKKNFNSKITEYNVLEYVNGFPIFECYRSADLFDQGIGYVVVAKQVPNGMVFASVFMIDVFCLGVKDCFSMYKSLVEYEQFKYMVVYDEVKMDACCAKKLVLDSVTYARKFYLQPHEDYHESQKVLEGIDETLSSSEFEFGRDGMPLYCADPHDTSGRVKEILKLLGQHAGEGNFHFMVPV